MKQPTIIAVTGHTEPSYLNKALDSGMNFVLSKPIEVELLKEIFSSLHYELNTETEDQF